MHLLKRKIPNKPLHLTHSIFNPYRRQPMFKRKMPFTELPAPFTETQKKSSNGIAVRPACCVYSNTQCIFIWQGRVWARACCRIRDFPERPWERRFEGIDPAGHKWTCTTYGYSLHGQCSTAPRCRLLLPDG